MATQPVPMNRDILGTQGGQQFFVGGQPATQAVTMPATQTGPAQPLQIAKTLPQTVDTSVSLVEGVKTGQKTLQDYVKQLQAPNTALQDTQSALIKRANQLLQQTGGRGEALLKAENDAKVPELTKKLGDLTSTINSRVAQFEKSNSLYDTLSAEQETKPIPMNRIIGTQAAIQRRQLAERRTQAADIGILQAQAESLRGNLQTAKDTASRAVDLMYSDRLEQVDIAMKQLQLIQPLLDREQSEVAQARSLMLQEQQQALEEQKAAQKQNISLAMEFGVQTPFGRRNGEWFQASTGQPFSSPEHFQEVTGMTLQDAEVRGLVTDINPQALQERALVADLAGKYIDAGITLNDNLAIAQAKVTRSAIYQDSVRPPARSGGGGPNPKPANTDLKPTADTPGEIKSWVLANRRANPDIPYYELWGQIVDEMKRQGLNPDNYDAVLWETLHPEGSEGYKRELKKRQKANEDSEVSNPFD